MSNFSDKNHLSRARTVLDKIKSYGQKAGEMGHQARQLVFSFGIQPSASIDRWSLPVKFLQRRRILQRRQAFHQAGGSHSSIARYALEKARHGQQ